MKDEKNDDIDILARTLYGEAESGNTEDATAIACVILNRVKLPNWPDDVSDVCLQPWQFSCWNSNDPSRGRILKAKRSDAWFQICYGIAERAIWGGLNDITHRSTHYYATYIAKPRWAKKGDKQPVYRVKHRRGSEHLFFNDIDVSPPRNRKEALDQMRPLRSTKTMKATSGAVALTGAGAMIEVLDRAAPAFGMMDTLANYAPWALVAILLLVILYLAWKRYDARLRGDR